jgi:hypothetical protein
MPRLIIFSYTGIDTSSAPDASRKLQAVCPKGIGNCPLGADLKFPSIFLQVFMFQLGNDTFLFFRCHFPKMFLYKVLGLLFCTGGEEGDSKASQGSQ